MIWTRDCLPHCCVLLPCGEILDATHRHGVSIRSDEAPLKFQIIETNIPLAHFMAWVKPRLGMPFDFVGMCAQLVSCRIQIKGAYYCSSLISEFLEHYYGEAWDKIPCTRRLRIELKKRSSIIEKV